MNQGETNQERGISKSYISMCIPMCEKDIYNHPKIDSYLKVNVMKNDFDLPASLKNAFAAREINLENILNINQRQENSKILNLEPSDYLRFMKSHIPKELVSFQNFSEMMELASIFNETITSFQIFETRLNSYDAKSDYSFAVSYKSGQREILSKLIKENNLPKDFLKKSEWKQVGEFIESWSDPKSILYDNVIGVWFEFDTASSTSDHSIPSIFIQPTSNYAITGDAASQHSWITKSALPLLLGKPLPKKIEKKVIDCIKKLPLDSSLFQIGTMISRGSEIRLVIKRIQPNQIIPYLNSVGWADDEKQSLTSLLDEIKHKVTRIVLHISVGEKVNPKVGIECSFYPDRYHQEQGWKNFLDYLKENGLCNKEKYEALLRFPGIEPPYAEESFNSTKCIPSVMIPEENYSNVSIRYISHIKLVYQQDKKVEAKAYTAVRLFGQLYDGNQTTRLLKKN